MIMNSYIECIPVGCVPAAHRPYAGVSFPGSLTGPGGVCLVRGCLPGPRGGGVSAWSGGSGPRECLSGPRGVCLVQGGSAWSQGGVCLVWGGVWSQGGSAWSWGGWYPSMH